MSASSGACPDERSPKEGVNTARSEGSGCAVRNRGSRAQRAAYRPFWHSRGNIDRIEIASAALSALQKIKKTGGKADDKIPGVD
ncbi:hypothetical protein B4135_0849 [Caldibacillus debilis]|uniref:Uncharacterized protein n=1 Tax=Caldibacillus debilis TaxID=301148 RepID=A0A150M5R8_9BACI|nr:hypothetical protein B4135_0849 [Caldibacillus debilis]